MALAQYAGYEPESDPALVEPEQPPPSKDEIARRALEAENLHLKQVVRSLEGALRVAGKVLQPYLSR